MLAGLVVAAIVAGLLVLAIKAAMEPRCYGREPDGEVEVLHPCPRPDMIDKTFEISEDQYARQERD